MKLRIRHLTRFSYSRPVFIDPLTIRLRPRESASQQVPHFALTIWPEPAGMSECLDIEGNATAVAWFMGVTQSLTVTTTAVVETRCDNPFHFLMRNEAVRLPMTFLPYERVLAAAYAEPAGNCPAAAQLARQLSRETEGATVPFLTRLTAEINHRCRRVVRETGDAWTADQTLAAGEGSCRDTAVLFIECCRSVGIPARFVSGYGWTDRESDERWLHAWAEAYLPGAGWRGFDPSIGVATNERHVAVAAGITPLAAAPTQGTFRGDDVRSRLETQVIIRREGEAAGEFAPSTDIDHADASHSTMAVAESVIAQTSK